MKRILSVLIIPVLLSATKPAPVVKTSNEIRLSAPDAVGSTPRFTTNEAGNPVLSWVEKNGETARFYYAVSTDGHNDGPEPTFGPKISVPVPGNVSVHAEGMPKLAFKADGTTVALFEVPRPTAASRFAGDLLCVTSADGGKTWTEPKPVHRNTTPGSSHSFGDLTRLPNGEIGIVWLDEKLPGREGRPVKFVETRPGGGFGPEVLVDDNACQCCRTNVFVDDKNRIHLTYRDLIDKTGTEPGARDISHVVSVGTPESGMARVFSKPQVVVTDNWRIDACPHTGPALAQVGDDVFATWFSGPENNIGLRLARLGDVEPVVLIRSERARHPQVVSVNNQLVWLWDESVKKEKPTGDEPPYAQKIALRVLNGAADAPAAYLTPETTNASYPVGTAAKNGLLVAYEQHEGPDKSVIVCRRVTTR